MGTLKFVEEKPVDLSSYKELVRKAGFKLMWIEVKMVGLVEPSPENRDAATLRLDERNQVITIIPGSEATSKATFKKFLQEIGKTAVKAMVRGRAGLKDGDEVKVEIQDYQVLR